MTTTTKKNTKRLRKYIKRKGVTKKKKKNNIKNTNRISIKNVVPTGGGYVGGGGGGGGGGAGSNSTTVIKDSSSDILANLLPYLLQNKPKTNHDVSQPSKSITETKKQSQTKKTKKPVVIPTVIPPDTEKTTKNRGISMDEPPKEKREMSIDEPPKKKREMSIDKPPSSSPPAPMMNAMVPLGENSQMGGGTTMAGKSTPQHIIGQKRPPQNDIISHDASNRPVLGTRHTVAGIGGRLTRDDVGKVNDAYNQTFGNPYQSVYPPTPAQQLLLERTDPQNVTDDRNAPGETTMLDLNVRVPTRDGSAKAQKYNVGSVPVDQYINRMFTRSGNRNPTDRLPPSTSNSITQEDPLPLPPSTTRYDGSIIPYDPDL